MHPYSRSYDINEAHSRTVDESFTEYRYDYLHDINTLYVVIAVNSKDAICASGLRSIHGKEFLRDRYFMAMPAGRHQIISEKMIRDRNVRRLSSGSTAHIIHTLD